MQKTAIADCFILTLPSFFDQRGSFVKSFHEEQFRNFGLDTRFPEEFYSRSVRGVLRGIHFTVPPIDQVKMVTCLHGSVLDAVIDLRKGSPTYGEHLVFELSAGKPQSIYIGKGLGHAFYVTSDEALLHYRVSTLYSAAHDCGIRWDSAGIGWPAAAPVLSQRDAALPGLSEFDSPFEFSEGR